MNKSTVKKSTKASPKQGAPKDKSKTDKKRAVPSVFYVSNDTALLTVDQCRKADALAIEQGIPSVQLMENAGKQVATIVSQSVSSPADLAGPICVLCGPGNNGGDGFVAARYLEEWGFPVKLYLSCAVADLKGDAAYMADRWQGSVHPLRADSVRGASIIIDGLLGAGLDRDVTGPIKTVIEAANALPALKVVIDVPSGLDGDTGQVRGTCFQADLTITFFARKPAHVLLPGRFLCGGSDHIHLVDIGIPASILQGLMPQLAENSSMGWQHTYPIASPIAHKYNKGHVLVLGGREPTLGASRLCAMSALRSGAGLVSLACPVESYAVQATALTDVMVRKFDSNFGFLGFLEDPRLNVVTIGPGAGVSEKTVDLVKAVCKKQVACILDAEGISSFAGRVDQLIDSMTPEEPKMVITPHEGEFTRLFPDIPLNEDGKGRLGAARAAAQKLGAIVVLKGPDTIIAAPNGRAYVNSNAPVWLSVSGTGDVLAGMIAGLVAQGMPLFEASSAAVYFHSEAGMMAGKGLIASDLLPIIPRVLP